MAGYKQRLIGCICVVVFYGTASFLFADETLDRLIRTQKYSEAVAYADDKLPSANRTADVWVKLGSADEALGLNEKALACYFVGSRMDAKNYTAYYSIARIYNKLNQPDNALTYAQKAVDVNPTGEASWEYARACMALKRVKDAKSALERVINADPSNAAASRGLADIYWEEKDYKRAIPLLRVAYASQPNADDAYKIGRSLLESNKLDSAIFYLKEAITRNPNLLNANLDLAKAYYQKDKFLAAANEFEKIAGKIKLSAMDQYCRAVSQEKTGSMESALKAYNLAADAFGFSAEPEAIISHSKAGKADLEKKNYESAISHFRAIAAADSDSHLVPDINFLLADAYNGAGMTAKAIASLEKAVASDKNNVEAYARLADLYQRNNQLEKAKQTFEKITALSPNDPKVFLTLGDYNLKAKRYSDALKYYEKSFYIAKSPQAATGLALSAAALDKWDKAIDAAESAVHFDPSVLEPRMVLAKGFFRNNQYKEAKEQLEFLIAKKPYELEYIKQLAYCYKQLNDATNLSFLDKKIIELEKGNIESRLRLAKYYLDQRDYKQAYDLYKELSVMSPQNGDVFKNLYDIANNAGDKIAAAGYLKKYLTLSPADPIAQKNLGNLYFDQKNFDAALTAYRTALKLDPKIKGIYKQYSQLVSIKGTKEEMNAAMAGAIAAGEADASMYGALAAVYQKQGLCGKALELYQKALNLEPKNVLVLSGLARCQLATGAADAATISFEQVVALNPAAIDEYKMLGDLYVKKNREADAVSVYKKYLEKRSQDGKIAAFVGEYAYKQKNYEDASRFFSMVSGEDAKRSEFLFHFGQASYFAKNYKKAFSVLTQLAAISPQNPELYKLLYSVCAADNDLAKDAAGYLRKYVALKPTDAVAKKDLGDLLYSQKDEAGAFAAYKGALATDPTLKGIYKRYFDLATKKGTAADVDFALSGAVNAGEADAAMYAAQANSYFKQGLYSKAIPLCQKALAVDPKNLPVLTLLANCQLKAGNAAEASITYEQLIALNPTDSKLYKQLAETYTKLGKKDAAHNVYKKYLEKEPRDFDVAYIVGEKEYASKNYAEAVRYLSMVSGNDSKRTGLLSMLAQSYYQTKEYTKAKMLYKQMVAFAPQDPLIEKTLYDLCMRDGDKEEALSHLKRFAALSPKDAQAQRDLADALYDRKDMALAGAAYHAAMVADPAIKGSYKRYCEVVAKNGTADEIMAVYSAAVKAGEGDAGVYAALGGAYEKKAAFAKAIPMYQKALQYDSKNVPVLMSLAACQSKTGDVTEASITYEQVVALNPQDQKILKTLGDMYMQQMKTDQAMSVYKKYLEKQPKEYGLAKMIAEYSFKKKDYDATAKYFALVPSEMVSQAPILSMYAFACLQQNDYPKAKELYRKLAVLTPLDVGINKTLFDLCVKTNDKDGAMAFLRKYTAQRPKDADAQKDLADFLYDQKDQSGAYLAYRAAFSVNPHIKGIFKRYAELVVARGTPEEVLMVLNAAIGAGEADATMYATLGSTYEKKTFYPKAISYYNKALQLDQRNFTVISSLARCYAKSGDIMDAIVTYQQAVAINPDAITEYKILGDLYTKQNKPDQAAEAYKKYAAKAPNDPGIAMMLAQDAYKNKDYDGTIRLLAKIPKDQTNDPEYWYLLGKAYYNGKYYKQCAEVLEYLKGFYRDGKKVNPHGALMFKMLAESYDNLGDNANATAAYNAYTKFPEVKDADASYRKAQLTEKVSIPLAAAIYEQNAALYPKDIRNLLGAGLLYAKQPATLEKASLFLKKFLTQKDSIPTLWIDLGKIYGKTGRPKLELEAYQQYIQRDASNPLACEDIGVTLLEKHQANDAMVFLEMANALKPNDPDFMYQLSRGYVKTERYSDALPLLEKADKLRSNDAKIQSLYNFVLQHSEKQPSNAAAAKKEAW